MIGAKMTNGMTKPFRFNSQGKLTNGIYLTDDYKTSHGRQDSLKLELNSLPLTCSSQN